MLLNPKKDSVWITLHKDCNRPVFEKDPPTASEK